MNNKIDLSQTNVLKDGFVAGLAVFAIFFGAGNLIFPPKLGLITGTDYPYALAGYLLSGVLLPVLGLIALTKAGGTVDRFAACLGNKGTKILTTTVFLIIGPLFAVPRTAATSFEIFSFDFAGLTARALFSLLFFIIVIFFVFKKEKVIENIGKLLTPVLLLVLGIIIIKGIFAADKLIVDTGFSNSFEEGFFKGYQTMDALASIMLGGIIANYLNVKNYTATHRRFMVVTSIGIATVALTLVYGGLLLVGANFSGIIPHDLKQVETLSYITNHVLNNFGKHLLEICVLFACLTTAIGMTSGASDYFSKLTNRKISYGRFAIAVAGVSFLISISGVDKILVLAEPVLLVVYPVIIVLIITNLFEYTNNFLLQRGAIAGALLVSIPSGLQNIGIKIPLINSLPLQNEGLGWVIPSLALGLFCHFSKLCAKKSVN